MPRYNIEIPLTLHVLVNTDAVEDEDGAPTTPPTEEESLAEAERLADVAEGEFFELVIDESWTENLFGLDAERIENWNLAVSGETTIRDANGHVVASYEIVSNE